ncbi:hypothetical protein ANANG_G00147690 [Anguilla anguilla]|uniref:RING-type domain-containing protein n=1 Tax=Anguilla anguilla TaxID=7936 RepID=A0A9D3RWI4_ANGAN|nr:hypothetical protein ANANG_G00147690 [Anguilla anguilla]
MSCDFLKTERETEHHKDTAAVSLGPVQSAVSRHSAYLTADRMTTEQQEPEKRYDPADRTLRFVTRPDDITLDDDPDSLRAEMSCGHAVTPQSLTAWCRSLLDQGQYVFRCPALRDGTLQKCGAQWTYQEVRKLAVLTATEQRHFEVTLAALAAAEYCECKTCPGCQTSVERKNLSNLDRCDNQGCTNKDLELLKRCPTTSLPQVPGVADCPSLRACPTCGLLLEHDRSGCKNLLCSRCQVEFCFVCLKLTPLCLQTSTHFRPCQDGVAPRQTSIPAWDRSSTP